MSINNSDLSKKLVRKSEQLFNKQWLIGKQHLLLEDLILGRYPLPVLPPQQSAAAQIASGGGGGGGSSVNVRHTINQYCTRFSSLESRVQFVESYKLLGHNDYYVTEFLKGLRESPRHLASLIVRAERGVLGIADLSSSTFSCAHLISIVFQSLYGNCVLVQDEFFCLQLLNSLIEMQFSTEPVADAATSPSQSSSSTTAANSLDLRRLIRKQSCSFNVLFKLYTSFSHSTQLFLTAAL